MINKLSAISWRHRSREPNFLQFQAVCSSSAQFLAPLAPRTKLSDNYYTSIKLYFYFFIKLIVAVKGEDPKKIQINIQINKGKNNKQISYQKRMKTKMNLHWCKLKHQLVNFLHCESDLKKTWAASSSPQPVQWPSSKPLQWLC